MPPKPAILITGANGFVGSALGKKLGEEGYTLTGLTRLNCDYSTATLTALIEDKRPDVLIHAAGNASVKQSFDAPDETRNSSVGLTANILQAVQNASRQPRLVFLSTAAVYGAPEHLPIHEDTPLKPVSPYGEQKLACEQLIASAGLDRTPIILRIFSLFGAGQRRLVLYELFRQFVGSGSTPVIIQGTGAETRDFLSIDDFVRMTGRILAAPENSLPPPSTVGQSQPALAINAGSGQSYSILEAARLMRDLLGSDKDIQCAGAEQTGNPPHWKADISLFQKHFGPPFLFDFATELSKTLDQWKRQEIT